MRAKQLITVAVVSMLLIGGVAAIGAASPADQANENAQDAHAENAPEDAGEESEERDDDHAADGENVSDEHAADGENVSDEHAAAASEDRGSSAGAETDRGPKGDLPEQAPDHVSQIHETIDRYLSGGVDNLGHALSDLLGGDDAGDADDEADSADADETESEEDTDSDDDAEETEEADEDDESEATEDESDDADDETDA